MNGGPVASGHPPGETERCHDPAKDLMYAKDPDMSRTTRLQENCCGESGSHLYIPET